MPDGDENDGERALEALSEIGRQRRLLDEAELNAVRTARRERKSWAEIATKLGVSRQSAWEKWRDLDDAEDEGVLTRVAADLARRTRGTGTVPGVVGMSFDDAREVIMRARLVPRNARPDDEPLAPAEWQSAVVVRQYPDPGTKLRAGSPVKLWVERGGGSAGVREPRRPKPPLREATAEIDVRSVVGE